MGTSQALILWTLSETGKEGSLAVEQGLRW